MAQLNITLNQEEILALLSQDRDEFFRSLLQNCLNQVLQAESTEQLKAKPYERSEERTDSRNGSRERTLNTRIGSLVLEVPRHRNTPFKTMVFENYCRSEAALVAGMAEMVVSGVSTRKVEKVVEKLCGTSISKSAVSDLCKDLSKDVETFRNRPLTSPYPFLTVDATYFKVRENHRIISKAFMIAYGTNSQGIREILGFNVYPKESVTYWTEFLRSLQKRGLWGTMICTSDAHEGIISAIAKVLPGTAWQRCQFHFAKNISEQAPKQYQSGIRSELNEMFNAENLKIAEKKRDEILESYGDVAEKAMNCLDEGFYSAMTVMTLPVGLRRHYRTSNQIERLNKELKRRSKVIGIFPNAESLMRLMGSVLIEFHEKQQSSRAVFAAMKYEELLKSDVPAKLRKIAEEQQNLLAA